MSNQKYKLILLNSGKTYPASALIYPGYNVVNERQEQEAGPMFHDIFTEGMCDLGYHELLHYTYDPRTGENVVGTIAKDIVNGNIKPKNGLTTHIDDVGYMLVEHEDESAKWFLIINLSWMREE